MESICECKFNILNNGLIKENILLEETLGGISDILSNSNLDVLKCFKDIFNFKYLSKNIGGFIILGILFFQIILSINFLFNNINQIARYLNYLTAKFINSIGSKQNIKNQNKNNPKVKSKFNSNNNINNKDKIGKKNKVKSPPKKNAKKDEFTKK